MPLWRIFANPHTFSPSQRAGLAKNITELYASRGLPAFYVNVIFLDVDEQQFWVGGEPKTNYVRVVVEQIARTMATPDTEEGQKRRRWWMDLINEVRFALYCRSRGTCNVENNNMDKIRLQALKPFIIDREELDWELHVCETPRDLWRIQGLDPPPPHSDNEKLWAEKNRAIPYV